MSKDPVVQFGVFYALLLPGVFGLVPSPTNFSVVCHNFVNTLFWNYSNPTQQIKFSVEVKPYLGEAQTVDTSQTYLDISSYSRDVGDDYFVSVTAHDGQEKSKSVSIKFTYTEDFFEENKYKYKCSLDFPDVNTSVHKDVIEVSFQHPFVLYKQDMKKHEDFMYTITHHKQKVSYPCFWYEVLCTAKIHFNQSAVGHCVDLKVEGNIAGINLYTYRNVCVPRQTPETDKTMLIAALLGGGTIVLFIIMGSVWLLCRKLIKMPKMPDGLLPITSEPSAFLVLPEATDISPLTPPGHKPILEDDLSLISPQDEDCETVSTLDDTVVEVSEEDVDCEDFESFGRSSDYDSPKFLQEMSPGDNTEGYGPRPPVI